MNNQITPDTSKRKSVKHFYSKIATGEIIAFVILMIFAINLELALNRSNKIIMIWMFVFIFLGPSIFVYLFTWYYLRVDLNGLTILYRFHYKRIEWTEITQITAKMRFQKQKSANSLLGIGLVVIYPYFMRTAALQLHIYTSKNYIKTPNQALRFNAINHFLNHIITLQKYSITRIDSEARERGRLYEYINWEIKASNSLSNQLSPNDRFNLYLRNNSGRELNQSLSRTYKLALIIFILGLIELFYVMAIFLLGKYDLFFVFILFMGGIGLIFISIIISLFTQEARKTQEFQPILHI